jgi:hypothetical protein
MGVSCGRVYYRAIGREVPFDLIHRLVKGLWRFKRGMLHRGLGVGVLVGIGERLEMGSCKERTERVTLVLLVA